MRFSSCITAAVLASAFVFLPAKPGLASELFFSGTGSGTTCSQSAPCTLVEALSKAVAPAEELSCADSNDASASVTISKSIIIDCAGTSGSLDQIIIASGATVTLRNFTIWDTTVAITLQSGTLIMENVHIAAAASTAILANPTSSSTLVIKNSIIDNGSGLVLKPNSGGSLSARLDHVTITGNVGGGLKIDTTNGPVIVDITDSEISSNGGNGLNAVGGAGGPAMFSIHNSVIAKNGTAGVQVNGATAAAIIDTTLLDSNTSGATSVVAGGNMLTYGNNRIVGSLGSGFTGSAPLQ